MKRGQRGPGRRLLDPCVVLAALVLLATRLFLAVREADQAVLPEVRLLGASPGAAGDDRRLWGAALPSSDGVCPVAKPNTEYGGRVVKWGANNLVADAGACCASCAATAECSAWVFCGEKAGCGLGTRAFGECWLKASVVAARPELAGTGPSVSWTSGALFDSAMAAEAAAKDAERLLELARLRYAPGNPRVFFDIEIDSKPAGRMEMMLFTSVAPRAATNFLRMCTGEKGGRYTYQGARFYRILDLFIDQTGVDGVGAIDGSTFDDDPGGLALLHDRPGLLSCANSGKNTNTNHFSIMIAPAPHLNGAYTIFGEVVRGFDVAVAINKLASASGAPTGAAVIVKAGQLE